jgi:putative acetyltransferase
MEIRPERPEDREAIAEITRAAFGRDLEARMIVEIRDSEGFVPELSLVAEAEGEIVGHVILSYVDLAGKPVLALGPISVVPRLQRQKIGSLLVHESVRRAELRGEPLVLLLGHPWYYPRFGFKPARELGIEPPDDGIPDEAWMALPLEAYDESLTGRVVWPPAFLLE